jgi:hypothetical protein
MFKDFTKKRVPVKFQIDDDVFECVSGLSIFALQDVIKLWRGSDLAQTIKDGDAGKIVEMLSGIFKIFVQTESFDLFMTRLSDTRQPIDIQQLLEIVSWIVEVYTRRPTQPSLDSSNSSQNDDGGTSSLVGARLDELIPSS